MDRQSFTVESGMGQQEADVAEEAVKVGRRFLPMAEKWLDLLFGASRERLITVGGMTWPMRLFLLVIVLELAGAGVLVGLRDQLQPMLIVHRFVNGAGQAGAVSARVQEPLLVIAGLLALVAWAAVLTGAIHGHLIYRVGVPLLFGGYLLYGVGYFYYAPAIQWMQGALIGVIILWTYIVGILRPPSSRARQGGWQDRGLPVITFGLMVALLLAYAALAGFWSSEGPAPVILTHLATLDLFFLPLFAIGGMGVLDTGNMIVARVAEVRGKQRPIVPMTALAALLPAGVIAYVFLFEKPRFALGMEVPTAAAILTTRLVALVMVGGALLALGWIGKVSRWPRVPIPYRGVIIALCLLYILALEVPSLGPALHLMPLGANTTFMEGVMAILLLVDAPLGIGLLLVARGRRRPGIAQTAGYFLSVCWISLLCLLVTTIAGMSLRYPALRQNSNANSIGPFNEQLLGEMHTLQIAFAALSLLLLLWALLRRRPDSAHRHFLAALVALNIGLAVIAQVATSTDSGSAKIDAVAALLLMGGLLWDFLASGKELTNGDTRAFPRYARLLLYGGFTGVMLAAVGFFSAAPSNETANSALALQKDIEHFGLIFAGVPLVLSVFALEVGHWWRARKRGASATVASPIVTEAAEVAERLEDIADQVTAGAAGDTVTVRAGLVLVVFGALLGYLPTFAVEWSITRSQIAAIPLVLLATLGGTLLLCFVIALAEARRTGDRAAGIGLAILIAAAACLAFVVFTLDVAQSSNMTDPGSTLAGALAGVGSCGLVPVVIVAALVAWLGGLFGAPRRARAQRLQATQSVPASQPQWPNSGYGPPPPSGYQGTYPPRP
jgi:hypothetical protein